MVWPDGRCSPDASAQARRCCEIVAEFFSGGAAVATMVAAAGLEHRWKAEALLPTPGTT